MRSNFQTAAACAVALVVAACGGGSSSGSSTTVSGTSFKGPTAGASICFYAIDNAASDRKGAKVAAQPGSTPSVADGCVVTANDGTYTAILPAGTTGDLLVESTGGTYCSDESIYNGTSCSGGGTPIAMGGAKLKTVVGASGAVANAPLTLLTTAAVNAAPSLTGDNFKSSYATVAANVGIADTNPGSNPSQGELKTALVNLSTYVGGDTTGVDGVVQTLASGGLKTQGGQLATGDGVACSALEGTALQSETLYSCEDKADGSAFLRGLSFGFSGSPVLADAQGEGQLAGLTFANDRCAAIWANPFGHSPASTTTYPMAVTYEGVETLARQASADASKSQSGTASKLAFTIYPGTTQNMGTPGASQAVALTPTPLRTEKHLFCRTGTTNGAPSGYLTSTSSPLKDGYFTRIDTTRLFSIPNFSSAQNTD